MERQGRRGGGVAVIYRQELGSANKDIGTFDSFEYFVVDIDVK